MKMGLGSVVRRVLGVKPPRQAAGTGEPAGGTREARPEQLDPLPPRSTDDDTAQREWARRFAERYLAFVESGRLAPPRNVHDRDAWDEYWKNQFEAGPIDHWFSDRMSSRPELPALLCRRGARTILCAGNGASFEAISLAILGFDVTALDISAIPADFFRRTVSDPEHVLRQLPGLVLGGDGSIAFPGEGPLNAGEVPLMHIGPECPPRLGGALRHVTGDLSDPTVCTGPYDVVIERRTVQLFPREEHPAALERLVARLAPRGTLVSHEHCGAWKPGDDRAHYAEKWLAAHGFVFWWGPQHRVRESAERLAHLMYSTG
jgi:hypothetical protein